MYDVQQWLANVCKALHQAKDSYKVDFLESVVMCCHYLSKKSIGVSSLLMINLIHIAGCKIPKVNIVILCHACVLL